MTLVINTLPTPPRSIGGGLDAPTAAIDPTRNRRARRRPTAAPSPSYSAPVVEQVVASVTNPLHPEALATVPDPEPVAVVAPVDPVTAALAALVPMPAGTPALRLVEVLAVKLDGHRDCHQLIHPAPGSLGLDEVRARCLALLEVLAPVERAAVLSLLTADLEGNR